MKWRTALRLLGLATLLGCSLNMALWAQEPPVPVSPPVPEVFDAQTKWLVMQYGFAGILLVVFFYVWKRLIPVEQLVKQYHEAQLAHLAAFKDINERNMAAFREVSENYRAMAKDMQSMMAGNIQVLTQVAERVAQRERPT